MKRWGRDRCSKGWQTILSTTLPTISSQEIESVACLISLLRITCQIPTQTKNTTQYKIRRDSSRRSKKASWLRNRTKHTSRCWEKKKDKKKPGKRNRGRWRHCCRKGKWENCRCRISPAMTCYLRRLWRCILGAPMERRCQESSWKMRNVNCCSNGWSWMMRLSSRMKKKESIKLANGNSICCIRILLNRWRAGKKTPWTKYLKAAPKLSWWSSSSDPTGREAYYFIDRFQLRW